MLHRRRGCDARHTTRSSLQDDAGGHPTKVGRSGGIPNMDYHSRVQRKRSRPLFLNADVHLREEFCREKRREFREGVASTSHRCAARRHKLQEAVSRSDRAFRSPFTVNTASKVPDPETRAAIHWLLSFLMAPADFGLAYAICTVALRDTARR